MIYAKVTEIQRTHIERRGKQDRYRTVYELLMQQYRNSGPLDELWMVDAFYIMETVFLFLTHIYSRLI